MIKTLEAGIEMTDYQKFKEIYDEIESLEDWKMDAFSPAFKAWKSKTERFLINYFGKDSYEVSHFNAVEFKFSMYAPGRTAADHFQKCQNGLEECKAVFETYLHEMENEGQSPEKLLINKNARSFQKVFVVHGHDDALKQEVARIIEKQGLEAIILSEQANQGKTVIEKIEEYANVDSAICLFTGDDYGKAKDADAEELRARQNVVFEAGYFMGKLGRKNVIIVADKNLELPSDMQGVVYTDAGNWKTEVLQGLDKIGYAIDFNKLFR